MRIANGIEMLEISADIMGKLTSIYPVVFYDKENVVLVDTGYPNQMELFINAFNSFGIPFEMLSKIIVTHHDVDHIGSLSNILEKLPKQVETLSHSVRKSYIEGEQRPVKLTKLEANLDNLPEQMQSVYNGLKAFYDNCKVNIDKTVTDGEVLPYCNGITVIYTPGHTPGHICLYHNESKTLIAGDALSTLNGELTASPAYINSDESLYWQSLKKLSTYDIETVICYHGGLFKGNVSQRIAELVAKG